VVENPDSSKKKLEPKKTDEETKGTIDKEGLLCKSERKKKTERAGGQKNEGRKERLKASIDEKETRRRRKPPLKTDYEHSVDKSYAKKRQ
jgi:hypothetical protein